MLGFKQWLFELSGKDAMREHIPVAFRFLPYWIKETWREQKRSATRSPGKFQIRNFRSYLKPNLHRPVFAIGAPRSGTTFLGESLAVLPELVYFFEPVATKAAVRHVYTGEWSAVRARLFYRSVYSWLMRVRHETDLVFCEKTPGNCFIVPFLYETFQDARFIHIIRDGRDSALSLAKKEWYANESKGKFLRDPDGYLFGPVSRFWVERDRQSEYENTTDLHRCLWLWRRYVEEAVLGFQAVPPHQVYQLRYEDLLSDTGKFGKEILDHIGIEEPASRRCFLENLEKTARKDSLGNWRRSLTVNDSEQMWTEAGHIMTQFGYTRE